MSDDSDEDLSVPVTFMSQFSAQEQHNPQMLAAADSASLTYRNRKDLESSDEKELQRKPVCGNKLFTKKPTYIGREQSQFYKKCGIRKRVHICSRRLLT